MTPPTFSHYDPPAREAYWRHREAELQANLAEWQARGDHGVPGAIRRCQENLTWVRKNAELWGAGGWRRKAA